MPARSTHSRTGLATVWALIALTTTTLLSATLVRQFLLIRRTQDQHTARLQVYWLARSGQELAVHGLLRDPKNYTGEVVQPIPGAEVRITVKPDATQGRVYHVESHATYTPPAGRLVTTVVKAQVRRTKPPDRVRVSVEPE